VLIVIAAGLCIVLGIVAVEVIKVMLAAAAEMFAGTVLALEVKLVQAVHRIAGHVIVDNAVAMIYIMEF